MQPILQKTNLAENLFPFLNNNNLTRYVLVPKQIRIDLKEEEIHE
jgi:hypothetical protein